MFKFQASKLEYHFGLVLGVYDKFGRITRNYNNPSVTKDLIFFDLQVTAKRSW